MWFDNNLLDIRIPPLVSDRACKWQLAFKAVRGNERVVSMDFFVPGGINEGIEAAKTATSDLVYRDSSILDRWEHLLIQQVCTQFLGV